MTDEQLVAAWLRMLNEQRSKFPKQVNTRAVRFDTTLAGRQSIVVDAHGPITREHLVARVEQIIQVQINDRLQGT